MNVMVAIDTFKVIMSVIITFMVWYVEKLYFLKGKYI